MCFRHYTALQHDQLREAVESPTKCTKLRKDVIIELKKHMCIV